MPQPQNGEVQISISLDTLVRAIDDLPRESLLQLLHATEVALAARAETKSEKQEIQVEDEKFWESELGHYISTEADATISVEEVRQALSVITGSLAAEISSERDER